MEKEKRLRPEGLDYLLAAIAPVFIIGMIGSLTYFFLTVFYNGDHPERLMWILGLYTVATVLIARIAIEQTRAHSIGYMVALGAATMLVAPQFFVIEGVMRIFSIPILLGLLVMIAVLADRITFDCTSMNEKSESSGIGLLQSLGLHRTVAYEQSSKLQREQVEGNTQKRKHNPGVWILYFALMAIPLFGVGQFFVHQPDDRSFAFKLLFIYLFSSLCLLVLIALLTLRKYLRERGIGMEGSFAVRWLTIGSIAISVLLLFFALLPIPSQSLFQWQSPLTITSRKDLEASKWGWGNEGANGGESIPPQADRGPPGEQPNANQGQPAKGQDPNGQPGDATSDSGNGAQKGSGQSSPSKGGGDSKSGSGAGGGKSKDPSSQSGPSGSEKSGSSPTKDPSSNGMQGSKDSRSNSGAKDPYDPDDASSNTPAKKGSEPGDRGSSNPSSQKGDEPGGKDRSDRPQQQKPDKPDAPRDEPSKDQQPNREEPNDNKKQGKPPEAQQGEKQKDAPKPPPAKKDGGAPPQKAPQAPPPKPNASSWSIQWNPGPIFQWLVLLILLIVAVVYGILHRKAIWDFIQLLLGKRKETLEIPEAERETMVADPFPPFLSFDNPFAMRGWTGEQVVRHLFRALQSWGYERRVVRSDEETPDEYVRRLAKKYPEQFDNMVVLGALYGRIAYSRSGVNSKELLPLQELWKWLRQSSAVA